VKEGGKHSQLCLHADILLGLFFDPEDGGNVHLNHQLTFNAIHGFISQKTALLITSAVKTLNPTNYVDFWLEWVPL
jgi:hypothetical protein